MRSWVFLSVYIAHARAPFDKLRAVLREGVPSGTTTYRSVWVILSGLLPEGTPVQHASASATVGRAVAAPAPKVRYGA
jgi:hypothetical protein